MSGPFRALRRRCTPSLKPMLLRWNPFVRATGHVRSIHRFGDGGLRFVRSLPLCGGAGGVRAIPVCSVSSASHEETASPFGARVFGPKLSIHADPICRLATSTTSTPPSITLRQRLWPEVWRAKAQGARTCACARRGPWSFERGKTGAVVFGQVR